MSVDPAILAHIDQSWAEMKETLDYLIETYKEVPESIIPTVDVKRVVFSMSIPMLGLNDPQSLACVLVAAMERIIELEEK